MQSKQSSFQNPNPSGEIFSSSSSSSSSSSASSFSAFGSSFGNANERTLDYSFSSPSVSRSVYEKSTYSSGLSRPRLVKVRKHFVSNQGRSTPLTEKMVDSGFNPFFHPASGTSNKGEVRELRDQWNGRNPFASNSAENLGFVFGSNGRSAESNLRTSGLGESVGKSFPDEMRKLNIGRGMKDRVNLNSGGVFEKHDTADFVFGSNTRIPDLNSKTSGLGDSVGRSLPDDMRKLNIGRERNERVNLNSVEVPEKYDNAGFVFGVSQRSSDSSGLGESVGKSLSDVMRKSNIGRETKERVVTLNSEEVSKNHGFVFGSSSEGIPGLDGNKVSEPAGEMRKLNSESSAVFDSSEKSNDVSKVDKKTFIFGISKNVRDADNSSGSSKNIPSGSSKNIPDSMSGSSESKLLSEMKKLNVQGPSYVEPEKTKNAFFQFDEKKTVDFESNKNNAGTFGGPPVSALHGEMGKLNMGSRTGGSGLFNDSIGGSTNPSSFTFRAGVQGNSGMASGPHSDFKLGEASVSSAGPGLGPAGNTFKVPSMDGADNKAGFSFTSSQDALGTAHFRAPEQDNSRSFMASIPNSDSRLGGASMSSSPFSSAAPGVRSVGTTFEMPSMGGDEKKTDFTFTSSQDGFGTPQFRASNQDNLAAGLNKKLEFSAKKGGTDTKSQRRKGKLKQNASVHQWPGKDYVSRESSYQDNPESPGSYSPMDFSPYEETLAADQSSREASVASDEFFQSDTKLPSTDAYPSVSINATYEASMTATGNLNIKEDDMKCGELNDGRSWSFKRSDGAKCPTEEFASGSESECMRSTSEKVDTDIDVDASFATRKSGANTSLNIENKADDDSTEFCFASSSDNVTNTNFAFVASPSAQGNLSASKRLYKKKSQRKVGQDSQLSSLNANIHFASPGMPLFPLSGIVSQSIPGRDKIEDSSTFQIKENHQSQADKEPEVKETSTSGATATDTAQDACEKWRLRGNQAYAKGNLSKADSYYTRGVNCVSPKEASKSCLKALVLCYSNRAATRMTLGRMREALEDCKEAMALDPNFLKIQVRAANCHLALGEIEDALRYFRKGAQSGDVCLDRKVVMEASDGLQKAQKVAGYIDRCTELLQQRKFCDAESALTIIAEALLIIPYSEKLVQMKAEALFMLRRYEEVVQLCEQTLGSASLNVELQSENSVGPESIKNSHARLWCWSLISKSYFNLGRLEEALNVLDKLERVGPITEKDRTNNLKSSISLSVTMRELLSHKAAGNEAFQSGKYSEAVEHYTAAVSCNVESRPFAAICFCNRAAAYQAIGQITDAIADCSLSIALHGDYPKAISRRATLHEMIRDYGKAANDLQRLVSLLENKTEDKANQSGKSARSTSSANDLRQARSRLSTMEEEARKEIPLNMYLILGVEQSVDASDIKKAYRKAALRHHPDKAGQFLARTENGDDKLWKEIAEEVHKDADRLFKIIGEAYAILSDSAKRSRYDLEEEIRNSRKRGSGNSSPRPSEPSPYEKSGSSRRQWQEFRKSYQPSHWSESSRSSGRYYDW